MLVQVLADEKIHPALPPVVAHFLSPDIIVTDTDRVQGIPHLRLDGLDTNFGLVVLRLGHSVELLLEIFLDADDEMNLVRDYLHLGGACDLDVTEFLRIRRVLGHERGRVGSSSLKRTRQRPSA